MRRLSINKNLHLIIVLPKKIPLSMNGLPGATHIPHDGYTPPYAIYLLQKVAKERVFVAYPQNSKGDSIYVHSKIMIVDDVFAIIGSANFTDRSMFERDEELGLAWIDHNNSTVRDFRTKLWSEHLDLKEDDTRLLHNKGKKLYQLWIKSKSKRIENWVKVNPF